MTCVVFLSACYPALSASHEACAQLKYLILLMDLTMNLTQLFTVPFVRVTSGGGRRVNSNYYADFKEKCI